MNAELFVSAQKKMRSFGALSHYNDMEPCDSVSDDLLDEVILGRLRDPDLLSHLGRCPVCSKRFDEYSRLIAALKKGLRAFMNRSEL